MGLIQLFNYKKKRFTLLDVASDEIAIMAFAFLIVKYWTAATSLAWYWYLVIMVIFWIKPIMAMVKN